MKIWHISDTHGCHNLLDPPTDADVIICSGDASNYKDPYRNEFEMRNFLDWYASLNCKYKIYVAGNHDTSIEKRFILKEDFILKDIIYLEDDFVIIENLKIYGSPITPTFGNWSFMKKREKLFDYWKSIPDDIDVLITHGPPKGILDLSYNKIGELEFCGDGSLRRHIFERLKNLKLNCFGHIHNHEDIINNGIRKVSNCNIIFSNGSVVTDGKFGKVNSNGNLINL